MEHPRSEEGGEVGGEEYTEPAGEHGSYGDDVGGSSAVVGHDGRNDEIAGDERESQY